jgi:hypothetical protein
METLIVPIGVFWKITWRVHANATPSHGKWEKTTMRQYSNLGSFLFGAIKALVLLLPLLLVTPSHAFGYADPGTGAFVYQAAYAAFLGGSFYLRKLLDRFWGKRK